MVGPFTVSPEDVRLIESRSFLPTQPIAKCPHCGAAIADKQSCGRSECPVETAARAA